MIEHEHSSPLMLIFTLLLYSASRLQSGKSLIGLLVSLASIFVT